MPFYLAGPYWRTLHACAQQLSHHITQGMLSVHIQSSMYNFKYIAGRQKRSCYCGRDKNHLFCNYSLPASKFETSFSSFIVDYPPLIILVKWVIRVPNKLPVIDRGDHWNFSSPVIFSYASDTDPLFIGQRASKTVQFPLEQLHQSNEWWNLINCNRHA